MDFKLDKAHELQRELFRRFAETEIAPIAKDMDEANKRVTDKVNDVCRNILFNTAVFKPDEVGQKGFENFLKANDIK